MPRLDDVETTLWKKFAIRYEEMGRSQEDMQAAMEDNVFVVCLLTGSISVSLEEKSPIEVSREIVAVKVHGRSWRTGFRASREVGPRQTGKHRTGCNLLQE